ncbi:hypothetical protein RJ639_021591 [Escallonia herrerae]|uniref:Retrotransposon gag domain-containing protein n=1 Tax=Escallonia herrerae TaxID=1293975 RepID=A0AA88V316_9ASTE|nr:hypothetical protein RJ639_021591 [Escallonia herrerae]
MLLLQLSDAVMCRAFPTTLRKAAHVWFKSLQPRSIHSFSQLSDIFQKHFVSSRTRRKNSTSLLNVVQEKKEYLSHYLGRFNAATLEIHNLDESREIEALIKRGHLKKYIARRDDRREVTPVIEGREERQENAGTINTISGGIAAGCSSRRGRKAYTRKVCITNQSLSKKHKTTLVPIISFSEDEIGDIKTPHDDPLLSHSEWKMNIPSDRLCKMDTPLYGFLNHPVAVKGIIALPVAIGTPPTQAKLMLDFVNFSCSFNLQCHTWENSLEPVKGSGVHVSSKNEVPYRTWSKGSQRRPARQCYMASCRAINKEAFIIEDLRDGLKENL